MITCTKCYRKKKPSEFSDSKTKKNGKRSWCKKCVAENTKRYYHQNVRDDEELKERKRQYDRERHRRRWDTEPEYREGARRRHYLAQYGITIEEFEALLKKQKGRCAICRFKPDPNAEKRALRVLEVDHDHETGEIRGLLCRRCNDANGKYEDSADLVMKAALYLARK